MVAFGLSLDLILLALLPLWLFLASVLPVLAAIWLGWIPGEKFYPATVVTGFLCYGLVLPFGLYVSQSARARRREAADERLSRFASRVVELYAATGQSPRLAADPQAAQAFRLYLLAGEAVEKNPHRLEQETRGMISRGTSLAERALAGNPEAASSSTSDPRQS